MFGAFRTLLALWVVIGHLHGPYQLGIYAVFGFYILSGYLMTTIMHRSYGYDSQGRLRYGLNRVLRLFPAYWTAILLSIVLLLSFGERITEFNSAMVLPTTWQQWAQNALIMLAFDSSSRLSPATWALTVEMFFYFCICVGASKTKWMTQSWFVVSVAYTIVILTVYPNHWQMRYFPIPAASLPFSIGAMIYHHRSQLQDMLNHRGIRSPLLWLFLACINFCVFYALDLKFRTTLMISIGFYINLFLMSACVFTLLEGKVPFISKRLDTLIGKFSYPIYLTHWQVGALINLLFFETLGRNAYSPEGLLFLLVSTVVVFLVAIVITFAIDEPIEKLRQKVKASRAGGAQPG